MSRKKRIIRILLITAVFAVFMISLSNWRVTFFSKPYLYDNVTDIPKNKVGLVLGTNKYLENGNVNYYFKYRIDAAAALYHAGKIDFVLVSGDNKTNNYNEPQQMMEALVKLGVPERNIYLDYAGFRTLDSVVRSKLVFGQSKITIVSQKFHNQRAIYIAHKNGIEAIGYNAQDVNVKGGLKTRIREVFARVKLMLDIYITGTQPHFLGTEIEIQ